MSETHKTVDLADLVFGASLGEGKSRPPDCCRRLRQRARWLGEEQQEPEVRGEDDEEGRDHQEQARRPHREREEHPREDTAPLRCKFRRLTLQLDYYGFLQDDRYIYFLTELLRGGDLFTYHRSVGHFNMKQTQ